MYFETLSHMLHHHIFHGIIFAMPSMNLLYHLVLCYYFVIIELILLPYLLVIPLSFVNTFDINGKYVLNNIPLWNWWKHLNILPFWQQWQMITCYAIEDFLSFFFLITPPVIISPPEIVLPPIQLLKWNYSHILSKMLKGFLRQWLRDTVSNLFFWVNIY